MPGVVIRKLKIERFRGIRDLAWRPSEGLNLLLGGGDVGKTTVLEAIALLLSPTNSISVSETDFTGRDYEQGFAIEAVIADSAAAPLNQNADFPWPWMWNGEEAVPPPEDGEPASLENAVYVVRVRGTPELELIWELVQPNGDKTAAFSVSMRRAIGVIKLMSEDRNDRDLRLVYGSALDRFLDDTALRARIGQKVAEVDLDQILGKEGTEKLKNLDTSFSAAALPSRLALGLTTSQGISIGALIGLTAQQGPIDLPLASWGAGTRRLAALEIASAHGSDASLRVIDEIERGLEPYRLRALIRSLTEDQRQCFITSHSAVAVGAATEAQLWFLSPTGHLGALSKEKITRQQERDPETFLARTAVIAEGRTELGFMKSLLEEAFDTNPLDHGVRVCYGEGNVASLQLLEALRDAGLIFAGFADNEGTHPQRWADLKEALGNRLFQWPRSCTEDEVLSLLGDDVLVHLFADPDGSWNGERARTVAVRLESNGTDFDALQAAAKEKGVSLKDVVIDAATGKTDGAPDEDRKAWKSHEKLWFKSEDGGRELYSLAKRLGAWPRLAPRFLPLVNELRNDAGLEPLAALGT